MSIRRFALAALTSALIAGPALAAEGLGAKMLLQVHDELLFEVPADEKDATEALVKRVMEQAGGGKIGLPLVVEAGWGDNWAEAH